MGRNADTDGRRLSRRGALSLVAGASLAGASLAAASSLAGLSSCAPSGAGEGAQDGVQEADPVGRAIASLSLEQRVCQLFVVRPEDIVDVGTVVAAGEATREALRRRPVGGICYFGRNLEDPDQVRRMLANVESFSEEAVGLPILRAVDEEGGTVARVASNPAFGVANVGDMRSVGAGGDADAAGPRRRRSPPISRTSASTSTSPPWQTSPPQARSWGGAPSGTTPTSSPPWSPRR